MKLNKRVIFIITCIICAITILSGTFAWWSSSQTIENRLQAADTKDVKLYEEFAPTDGWVPGQTVDKLVRVVQTGKGKVAVRAKLTEFIELYQLDGGDPADLLVTYQADPAPGANQIAVITSQSAINTLKTGYTLVPEENLTLTTEINDATGELYVYSKTSGGDNTLYNNTFYFAYYDTNGGAEGPDDQYQIVTINNLASGISAATFSFPFYTIDMTLSNYINYATPNEPNEDGIVHNPTVADGIDHTSIELNFGTNVYNTATAVTADWVANQASSDPNDKDKWYYSTVDGYYYYGQPLDDTIAQTTPLLVSLKLADGTTNQYKNMKYNLKIDMEAVQATEAAVKALWDLDNTNANVWTVLSPMLLPEPTP